MRYPSDQSSVTVSAGGRLHLGLLDLGHATRRTFGGIGCILDGPEVKVEARISDLTRIGDSHLEGGLIDAISWKAELTALENFIRTFNLQPTEVKINTELSPHVGLGSRTATTLAILAAAGVINGMERSALPVSEMKKLSGRGRTSGIGVHGFFTGGWVVDAGQPQGAPLLPSGAQVDGQPSMLVQRLTSPDWQIGLFRPQGITFSGAREVDFFRANTPVDLSDVLRGLALVYHGMVPALLSGDLEAFGSALSEFQSIGFKSQEIAAQPLAVRQLMARLKTASPCVGMSSFGPLLFAIGGSEAELGDIAAEYGTTFERALVSDSGWKIVHG